jgi:hypothetical protein
MTMATDPPVTMATDPPIGSEPKFNVSQYDIVGTDFFFTIVINNCA